MSAAADKTLSLSEAERTATAYHEAGHAVVALLLGFKVTSVTISPGQGYLGRAGIRDASHIPKTRYRLTPQRVEKRLMFTLAGPVAQVGFRPDSFRMDTIEGYELHWAMALASWYRPKDEAPAYYDAMLARTADLLEEHWPKVQELATRLLAVSTVKGKELADLIAEKPSANGAQT